ncbi:MAG: glycoside hydrolase family 15 protein [Bdellovibrionota bacterium]
MSAPTWNKISDYAMIGNCRTAALISNHGSIDWCCFPKFDSPSYFTRLLDPSGGHFALTPTDSFQSRQAYLEDTNVVQTRFTSKTGSASLTDLFPVKDPKTQSNELWPDEEILRILSGETGEIEFHLELLPRCSYGRQGIQFSRIGDWGFKGSDGRKHFLFQSSLPAKNLTLEKTPLGHKVSGQFKVRAGEKIFTSFSYSDEAPAVIPPLKTALERYEHTIAYWRNWSARCEVEGEYKAIIQRSSLALKLLNFAPSGAFVAAPTTSLPEWIGGPRNWDYRFCWLRDASFTTRALLRVGHLDEAKAFLNWLLHSTRLTWPRLQVLYSVYGESKIPETIAHWLSGYRHSKPVRIGNAAFNQHQLDVYGEVIDSFYSLAGFLLPIDRETQKMVVGFGKAVAECWREPDQGIWEFQRPAKNYTHSKVMAWVAMDRLAKLSKRFRWKVPYEAERIAKQIRDEIESRGFHPTLKAYTQAFGEPKLDASLLVMPMVGYCDAASPRFVATRNAIIRDLSQGDLIYRYPPGSDGLPGPEGTFTICNFWLAEAFAKAGSLIEAERYFKAASDTLTPTGLFSEELNPKNLEYLGNHVQGFSHIGLIHAALAIQEASCAQKQRRTA